MHQAQVCFRAAQRSELRMIGRNATAEDALHTLDKLRREGNLGHEQQHIATARKHLGHKSHIYFGLARTRNSAQKMHRLAIALRGANLLHHALLRGCERGCGKEDILVLLDGTFTLIHNHIPRLTQGRQLRCVALQQAAGNLSLGVELRFIEG